ncbi:MAG: cell division protein SepF [Gracilibacter sp. BRH_c7a]|nr:MAG: cell division protein SepF [Gracilibacter sp. BRH_c7a]
MAGLFDKFIGIMGFGDDENEEEYGNNELEEAYTPRGENYRNNREDVLREPLPKENFSRDLAFRENSSKKKSASVVSIHTQKQVRVIVVEPVSFEEAQGIAEHLKARKSVILNLEKTGENLCQRIVDFISGTTYALGGNMQKVGNGIFLFVPNNVDISGELNFRTNERDILWPKINN